MTQRIDLASLKRDHPIAEVVAGFGIELKRAGQALVGRSPSTRTVVVPTSTSTLPRKAGTATAVPREVT